MILNDEKLNINCLNCSSLLYYTNLINTNFLAFTLH